MKRADLHALIRAEIEASPDVDPFDISERVVIQIPAADLPRVVAMLMPNEVRSVATRLREDHLTEEHVRRTTARGHSRTAKGKVKWHKDWAPFIRKRLEAIENADAKEISNLYRELGDAHHARAAQWERIANMLPPGKRLNQLPIDQVIEVFGGSMPTAQVA